MKFRPVGTKSDGQTDMTKQIVAFRNFANAPKKGSARGNTCSSGTSSITNPIWTAMEMNQNPPLPEAYNCPPEKMQGLQEKVQKNSVITL